MAGRQKVEVEVVICEQINGMVIEIKKKYSKKKKAALKQQAVAMQAAVRKAEKNAG
ncbi:hypothetical protein [Phnomibacter ginsenosidimutans]|uniref:Uncharacterized protein n=1 Tax=Phnomibacter ginsenosidimutans TaxID=2676868 RepID=A0A6I6GWI9_9BACT|nr:hypothetical protein [Phnomibacter ginsenosidimutans]QGW29479.1 hypothetical protein GLV81_16425 [Phnomibacter ginsenosidimutans]